MYEEDLALNNLQGLICHTTQPNPTQPFNCVEKIAIVVYKQINSNTFQNEITRCIR